MRWVWITMAPQYTTMALQPAVVEHHRQQGVSVVGRRWLRGGGSRSGGRGEIGSHDFVHVIFLCVVGLSHGTLSAVLKINAPGGSSPPHTHTVV